MRDTAAAAATDIQQMLPLRLQSVVVRGFGRGSSDLGIPTANLDRDNCQSKSVPTGSTPLMANLPTGIYWGYARIGQDQVYTAAISIGYNPTYKNEEKTNEVANAIAEWQEHCTPNQVVQVQMPATEWHNYICYFSNY